MHAARISPRPSDNRTRAHPFASVLESEQHEVRDPQHNHPARISPDRSYLRTHSPFNAKRTAMRPSKPAEGVRYNDSSRAAR